MTNEKTEFYNDETKGLNLIAIDKKNNKEVEIFEVIFINGSAFGLVDRNTTERKILELQIKN